MSTVITLARENIARLTEAPEFSFNWHISQKSRTDPATKEKRLLNKVLIEKRPKQGRVRLGCLTIPFDCENGRSEDLAYLVKLLHEKLQDAPHLDLKEALDRITGAKKDVTFDWPLLEADYHRHIQQKGLTEAAWKDFYGKAFYRLRDLMVLPAVIGSLTGEMESSGYEWLDLIGPIIWFIIIPVTLLASTQEWTGIGARVEE